MLFSSRFWMSVLAAGMVAVSGPALADAKEDYDQGYRQFHDGDMVSAMTSLRKAVAAGHVKAMVLLAEILDGSEFDEEAIALYRRAAEQGDPDGMFGLGVMTAAGEGLKQKNPAEGLSWVRKAAEQGQAQAINLMAQVYIKGELGLTDADRNSAEALRWIAEAAAKDYLPAVDALAEAYRTGGIYSVSADPEKSALYVAQGNKIRQIEPVKGKKKKKTTAG